MGTTADPSLIGSILCFLTVAVWVGYFWLVLTGRPRRNSNQPPAYREIPQREMADERAGFIQAKLEKIERASR